MEIENIKRLIKIKLLKTKNINESKIKDIKSQSLNILTPENKKVFNKIDFIKEINAKEKHIKSFRSLKKIPKRIKKINFEEKNNSNIFNTSSPKTTSNYKVNLNDKFDEVINRLRSDSNHTFLNLKNMPNFQSIKFKNKYIVKFGQIADNFEKFKNKYENINDINKNNFDKNIEKIITCIKNQSSLLFNSIIDISKAEIQELITSMDEYNNSIYKLFNIFLSEINNKSQNNNIFSQINRDFETEINLNNIEIENLKQIINSQKIMKLYSNKAKVDAEIEKARLEFLQENNDNKIIINNLNKEIKNLNKMINKSKEYYNLFIKDESIIKTQNKEIKDMKKKHLEEINLLKGEILDDKNIINELNKKIEELNIEIKENEKKEKININHKIQIKNLISQNMKIYENYLMVKEDLDSFLYIRNNNPKNKTYF